MKRVLPSASRYTAADYAGQILQQCMDMIRYQPPATNLTVPTSAAYGENVTPGSGTGDREHELWRRGFQVCSPCLHPFIIMNSSPQNPIFLIPTLGWSTVVRENVGLCILCFK